MSTFDPNTDYYAILQVHPRAHQEVIKRAYHTLVGLLRAHPDLGGSHEEAIRLNQAYTVLSHPDTRTAYDAARRERVTTAERRRGDTDARRRQTFSDDAITVRCSHCGTQNRLAPMTPSASPICGKCHSLLCATPRASRAAGTPMHELILSSGMMTQLLLRGEIYLRRSRMPADHHLVCRRCGQSWVAHTTHLPRCCQFCHSRHWSDFRLFRCQYCGHQFSTRHLSGWPYRWFPVCPACHYAHWHPGCERHPLRWLLGTG